MSKIKVQFEIDRNLALKLPQFSGNMLVVGAGIRGEIMNWVLIWLESVAIQDLVLELVLEQGITTLVELSDAAFQLQLVPLFESCSKLIAGLVKNKTVAEVREFLNLNNGHAVKLSLNCIEGFLKYVPSEQRL